MLSEKNIPERSHILVAAPECFFQSPPPELLGEQRKLMAMACNSTPITHAAIEHFLRVMEKTDPDEQRKLTDDFFDQGQASEWPVQAGLAYESGLGR
jgi:hypothetical protein